MAGVRWQVPAVRRLLLGDSSPPHPLQSSVLSTDVPSKAPTGWLAIASHLGPSLIISASIVGSGELIVTPKVGAANGFGLLWFITLACVLKVFVQIELARIAIVERMTSLEILNHMPGPRLRVSWVVWLWLVMYVGLVFQVGGLIGGVVLVCRTMGFTWSPHALLVIITASCALLLVSGRYKPVEHGSTIMVAMFTLSTIVALVALQWTPYRVSGAQIVEGLSFHLPASFTVAFAAFGIIGVGGSELLYYPYWCLEKGYAHHIGPRDGSIGWRERAAGWIRVLKADAMLSLVIYTGATVAFYILGAAVLHARGAEVTDRELIETLGEMYRQTLGAPGKWIFLIGGFAVLYSTFFVATASNARLLADALSVFGVRQYGSDEDRRRMVRLACIALPTASAIVYFLFPQPVVLVLIGAVGQGIMLPFIGATAVYFHHKRVEPTLGSSIAWKIALWVSAAAMVAVGAYQFFGVLRGG